MPRRPPRPCGYPGCPRLTHKQYCDEHARKATGEYNRYLRDPATSARYNRQWRRIRDAFIAEHPMCEMCLREGRLNPAFIAHHIVPAAKGGSNDPTNLMALCLRHHSSIHMHERRRR